MLVSGKIPGGTGPARTSPGLGGCLGLIISAGGHVIAGGTEDPLQFPAAALGAFHLNAVILVTQYENLYKFMALTAFEFINWHDKLLKFQLVEPLCSIIPPGLSI